MIKSEMITKLHQKFNSLSSSDVEKVVNLLSYQDYFLLRIYFFPVYMRFLSKLQGVSIFNINL